MHSTTTLTAPPRLLLIAIAVLACWPPAATANTKVADKKVWTAEYATAPRELRMSVRFGRGGESRTDWNIPLPELKNVNFKPGENAPRAHFEVLREAGVFVFDGAMNGGKGSGTYTFFPNPDSISNMRAVGYAALPSKQDEYGIFDVSTAFARQMRALGYGDSIDTLVEYRMFNIDTDFIAYVAKLKGGRPTSEDLTDCRMFHVDDAFINTLRRLGFGTVSLNQMVSMRVHGVTPEFIADMHSLGYPGITVDELIDARIHGVGPEFIRALQQLGYSHVPLNLLVDMRIFGVDATFVRSVVAKGNRPAARELVDLKRKQER